MKKLFKLLMIALIACCLFACGKGGEGGGEETVGGGSLVIYSPNSDALVEAAEKFGCAGDSPGPEALSHWHYHRHRRILDPAQLFWKRLQSVS